MAGRANRDLVMALVAVLVAVGALCAPAHVAWARQDLRVAVARDPGDGVLGEPGDGFGGDPNDGSDGDPTDGEDANTIVPPAGSRSAGDPGDGDGVTRTAGDPGDGDEGFPGGEWRISLIHWLTIALGRASR
jgi:hypothetical protein